MGRGRDSSSGEKRGRIGWGTRTEGVRERCKDFDALRNTFTEVVEGFTEAIAGAVDPVVKLIVGHKRTIDDVRTLSKGHTGKFEGSVQEASPLSRPQNRTFGSHIYQCHDFLDGTLEGGEVLVGSAVVSLVASVRGGFRYRVPSFASVPLVPSKSFNTASSWPGGNGFCSNGIFSWRGSTR